MGGRGENGARQAPSTSPLSSLTRSALEDMAAELMRAKREARGAPREMNAYVVRIKTQLLRLLSEDLAHRIRNELGERFPACAAAAAVAGVAHSAERAADGGSRAARGRFLDELLTRFEQRAQDLHAAGRAAGAPPSTLQPLEQPHRAPRSESIPGIKCALRQLLWEIRVALEPFEPSDVLRTLLEEVRASMMDNTHESDHHHDGIGGIGDSSANPAASASASATGFASDSLSAVQSATLQFVVEENMLMLELYSLRILLVEVQRAFDEHCPAHFHGSAAVASALAELRRASAALRVGTYRVRGRSRVSAALQRLLDHAGAEALPVPVQRALENLRAALVEGAAYTISPAPPALHGDSMLLRPRITDIPNFERVTDRLLRGGQPSAAGIKWLADYGVRTAVDLRGADRANQWAPPDTAHWRSIRRYNIEIEDFGEPTHEQVAFFVRLLDEPDNVPLFISCKAGIGRTGTMVACWRVSQGESVESALRKERLYGADGGGLRQENFVRRFAAACREQQRQGGAERDEEEAEAG